MQKTAGRFDRINNLLNGTEEPEVDVPVRQNAPVRRRADAVGEPQSPLRPVTRNPPRRVVRSETAQPNESAIEEFRQASLDAANSMEGIQGLSRDLEQLQQASRALPSDIGSLLQMMQRGSSEHSPSLAETMRGFVDQMRRSNRQQSTGFTDSDLIALERALRRS